MTDDPTAAPAVTSEETTPAGVVHNTFALVRVLSQAQRPVGVTGLASVVGIPKTTAHRLLEQMAREGIVTRRDHKWALAPGFGDLARPAHQPSPEALVARPRLQALSHATGATLLLHRQSGDTLETLWCWFGPHFRRVMPPAEQRLAAVHPASAIWRALRFGELAAEYQEVHPGCNCIAAPFFLPSGDTGVVTLVRPDNLEVESLKRPLERVASKILSDMRRLEG
ncbi:helix-turn-helix domain-containing protein [Streptomyces sp. NPDC046870]|uniref:helix-turn-helix domain-containing protein n=1 Tax=Streptomyces sp. NPDC046870 TaxID=3155135 RepID=UPI003456C02A